MDQLILKRAALSRSSGRWNDDDFDVLAGAKVVGRIYKASAGTRLALDVDPRLRAHARRRTATRRRARLRWQRSLSPGGGNRPALPLARALSFSSRLEFRGRGANLNRGLVFEVGAGRIRTSHAAAPVAAEGRVTDGRTRSTPPGVKVTPAT
jgi:hypothetical protein